ncbi:hypothetical protein BO94DRAFT_581976 [Aspergillus sclerotioniger CBS 115572]|uniref:Uncharacterized protein n=1 Tax=Aspergillus sclerotioniger CBS 115572 TaxID=1450535 RepID=A0A317X8H7_9EURO|nr:hypothetical protein BO94DRAFT_581976 [Aspergillus sclerotioniger CBS 115572]PWY94585.1 hypothetical protein BO94DRAFT_581976 [Aspergillus sclerotioniger CBS 115572]
MVVLLQRDASAEQWSGRTSSGLWVATGKVWSLASGSSDCAGWRRRQSHSFCMTVWQWQTGHVQSKSRELKQGGLLSWSCTERFQNTAKRSDLRATTDSTIPRNLWASARPDFRRDETLRPTSSFVLATPLAVESAGQMTVPRQSPEKNGATGRRSPIMV